MQRPNLLASQLRFSRRMRIPHRAVRIHVRKCVQLRLQLFNPLQIMLSHFLRSDFLAPDFPRKRCQRFVMFRHDSL